MKKTLLSILLLLAFTACNERKLSTIPSQSLSHDTITAEPNVQNIDTIKKPTVTDHSPTIETTSPLPQETPCVKPMVEPKIEPVSEPLIKEKVEPKIKTKTHTKSTIQTFAGGTVADGLDIGIIRLGKEGATTRLVFDSFKWNIAAKTPVVRSYDSGHYTFKYNPHTRRITAVVNGYRGFSALQAGKVRTFGSNEMVRKIYLEKYLDDSAYKFTIELKKNANVNVFELKGPGRIIVDISPI